MLYKSLKHIKLKVTPTSSQPVAQYTHTTGSKITLPNTDVAHDKCLWTIASNFSQARLCTSWWWISWDPKHVGVTFNFMCFKLLYNVDFNSKFCTFECISRLIKVIDYHNARWKLETKRLSLLEIWQRTKKFSVTWCYGLVTMKTVNSANGSVDVTTT